MGCSLISWQSRGFRRPSKPQKGRFERSPMCLSAFAKGRCSGVQERADAASQPSLSFSCGWQTEPVAEGYSTERISSRFQGAKERASGKSFRLSFRIPPHPPPALEHTGGVDGASSDI